MRRRGRRARVRRYLKEIPQVYDRGDRGPPPNKLPGFSSRETEVAANIGKAAERRRAMIKNKSSAKGAKAIREQRRLELTAKIKVLRGSGRAKDRAEQERGPEDDEEEDAFKDIGGGADEIEVGPDLEEALQTVGMMDSAGGVLTGGGGGYWGDIQEKKSVKAAEDTGLKASVEDAEGVGAARAIARAEVGGAKKASSESLLWAGERLQEVREFNLAAEVLELVSDRIDQDLLQRRIESAVEAEEKEERALVKLLDIYSTQGKSAYAWDKAAILSERGSTNELRLRGERAWVTQGLEMANKLTGKSRHNEALLVLEEIYAKAEPKPGGTTANDVEEVGLSLAMCLNQLKQVEEAKEILLDINAKSLSKKRRQQAVFIMDVICSPAMGRNKDYDKIWNDAMEPLMMPQDGGRVRISGGMGTRMAEFATGQTALQKWTREYWDKRMKSPVYYASLVLFVTWPFAIPVISIGKKAGLFM